MVLGLLLCVSQLPGVRAGNVDSNSDPCTNTINGVVTDATTDADGNIVVVGCGNVVNNVTKDGTNKAKVSIYGSDNTVEDDVVGKENSDYSVGILVGTSGHHSNRNTIVGNVADYIGLRDADDNDISDNVVLSADKNPSAGSLEVDYSNSNTVHGNRAGQIYLDFDSSDDIEKNVVDPSRITDAATNPSWAGVLYSYSDANSAVDYNVAGFLGFSYDSDVTNKYNDATSDYTRSDTSVDVEGNNGASAASLTPCGSACEACRDCAVFSEQF